MISTSEEKIKQLRMFGMLRAFESSKEKDSRQYTADELVRYLIDAEWDDRYNCKINRLLTTAKFGYSASIEEVDYAQEHNIDKNQIFKCKLK